jgi:aldehyde dehydrogenase (NAD+)
MELIADILEARADQTSTLVTRENGTPIGLSRKSNELAPAIMLRTYANLARTLSLETPRRSLAGAMIFRREPVGVVATTTPWSFPQSLATVKVARALAAGCTVVLKPSPETAFDSYVFADAALEAGLPAGVRNVVLGGPRAGAALVSAPGVDTVAFTGSTVAGRKIGAECRLARCRTLELGGKSAALVLDDVDLDSLRAGVRTASFTNNSQACVTQARILAPRSRYDDVVEAVAACARGLVVGEPLDPQVEMGPMASEEHLGREQAYVNVGRQGGARLVAGGGRPDELGHGWFIEPTVFADVAPTHRLPREEVFGPVLAVIPYDSEDQAVEIANDGEYGLAGSAWTADEGRGIELARRVRTGTIGVNYDQIDAGAPFGGMKQSGIGRELGPEGIESYVEYKSMYVSTRHAQVR